MTTTAGRADEREDAPPADQVLIILVLFGLASGASVTLSTVPPAALVFVGMVTVAGLTGMAHLVAWRDR